MELGALHVGAALVALAVGTTVLARRKGGSGHVALGRLYLATMLVVNLPVLLLYENTGGAGPFHLLAVVSVVTTGLGWLALRGPRRGPRVLAHAHLMTWSWLGVATAGLAQWANRQWPEQSPWPVVSVVSATTLAGVGLVPRYVSRQRAGRHAVADLRRRT